jgi:hypothetical protein
MQRALAIIGLSAALAASAPQTLSPGDLVRIWDAEHISSPVSPLVDHAEVKRRIAALSTDVLRIKQVGQSLEGREIYSVSFGTGPFVVLMWSQMHGDEPTATSALFDLFEYLQRHRSDAAVQTMLKALTVHAVPMLNPDGAERWQRRNVQGLDVNRDALLLQSPEGQLLKRLRDELNPRVGFNLHNQAWNTTSGKPPVPAAISLLSVAYDDARTVNEGRLLTKQLAAVVRDALEPLAPGRIGKYDDEFEVRAFGDNLTKWGTPVLLIETGPWPDANPDPALVRLNFVALARALLSLADGSVAKADPGRYDTLGQNESRGFYYLIRNVGLRVSPAVPIFTGDVGIAAARRIRLIEGQRRLFMTLSVSDLGDLRTYAGLFEVDGSGKILAPALSGATVGAEIDLATITATMQTGSQADLMLVEEAGAKHRVVRLFPAQQEVK